MTMMPRTCSQCGTTGHNSRTCSGGNSGAGDNSILLFGVRVTQGNSFIRKSASMTDLSHYEHHHHHHHHQALPHDSNADHAGYASDDVVHASAHTREQRKRGVPWTEEEHRLFLLGLQQVGKGDWRGISRNFVKTRTPTQVASHAQKYFIRRHNYNRRRRRSSLFDITTTDTVMESASKIMDDGRVHQEAVVVPPKYPHYCGGFEGSAFPVATSAKMANLNMREEVQVVDSLPASKEKSQLGFEVVSGKISGANDSTSMISVA